MGAKGWGVAGIISLSLAVMLVTAGYLVVPILFSHLPSVEAGKIAGHLFSMTSSIVLVGLFILITWLGLTEESVSHIKTLIASWIVMLGLAFWISPWMQSIKAAYPAGLLHESADWPLFASLHVVYQLGYLVVIGCLFYAAFNAFSRYCR